MSEDCGFSWKTHGLGIHILVMCSQAAQNASIFTQVREPTICPHLIGTAGVSL